MAKEMITLSKFISKMEGISGIIKNHGEKTDNLDKLIPMLKQNLEEKGDIEFDLNEMLLHLGIK